MRQKTRLRAPCVTAFVMLAALGCAKTKAPGSVAGAASNQAAAASNQARPASTQAGAARETAGREAATTDLAPHFKDFRGAAFVLYDLKRERYVRHNEARCRERFPPFSTFKIPNSLIGLESGVIRDADFLLKWDAKKYPAYNTDSPPFNTWWQDQTLRTAFRRSALWYFRELAIAVGRPRMKEYVARLGYGNGEVRGPVNNFWLDGSLRISPDEQVDFLRRLHGGELPFSPRSVSIVKEIMTLEETPDYRLSGKTGGGSLAEGRVLGWFVGYLEARGETYFFATQIEGPTYVSIRDERVAVTKRVLAALGYMRGQ